MKPTIYNLPDADVRLYETFFDADESQDYFDVLQATIAWQQPLVRMFGKQIPVPRLTAWYGDEGKVYSYSGITNHPLVWTKELLAIKTKIETVADTTFNSVLLNLYRDENDSMGWHSDDEPELGQDPVIASVTFGTTREFQLKHKTDKNLRQTINLTSGSLLLMQGSTQHHWLHRVPKRKRELGTRMNLTFRVIVDKSP